MSEHVASEQFLESFAVALDDEHPKKGAKAGVGGLFGGGVVAVMRGLALAGIPWATILTLIPLIIELRQAGKSWAEVLAEIVKKFLEGGFAAPPAAPVPPPA